jgi:hypothetical protein
MSTTKITIRLLDVLNRRLKRDLLSCFIKRDQFVSHLIKSQLPSIQIALKDKHLSSRAKSFISNNIKKESTLVNLQIDKDIASELTRIVKEGNLVRDALINRIIFFAVADHKVLKTMRIPTTVEEVSSLSNYLPSLPIAPIKLMQEVTIDPFYFLNEAFQTVHSESMYLIDFSDFNFNDDLKKISCLSCYLDESQILDNEEFENLLKLPIDQIF